MALLYQDITYRIRGACIEAHNDYGGKHREVIYQRALGEKFPKFGLSFVSEPRVPIVSKDSGKQLGWYQPDFIVEDKVIVEIKSVDILTQPARWQAMDYLRNTPYHLALLVNFAPNRCIFERIVYDIKRSTGLK